ncbi:hypothetical protein BD769DRAFT_1534074 [Suillus cothurnatus]|nr:hypothetical protein BD769DRAFT_1534074 [Suillus cothurnatus]
MNMTSKVLADADADGVYFIVLICSVQYGPSYMSLGLRSSLLYPSDHPRFLPWNMVRSISRFRSDYLRAFYPLHGPTFSGGGGFHCLTVPLVLSLYVFFVAPTFNRGGFFR